MKYNFVLPMSLDRSSDIYNENARSFIGMPRELRDGIYYYLLDDKRRAPPDPEHAGER